MSPLGTWTKKPQSGLRVTWLGHSTMLIEIDGVRVLTDPVWGPRASPSALVGPKRFQPVPVTLREMPPVDVVVISHDHYDHLDYPTIRALAKTRVPFVTSLGVGAHLEYWGVAAGAHHRTRLVGIVARAQLPTWTDRRAVAAFFRARLEGSQCHAVVLHCGPLAAARGVLQRRYGSDDGISIDPRDASAPSMS